MKSYLNPLICILIGVFLFSCHNKSAENQLLSKAQRSLLQGEADKALRLLDSIANPESMDKDAYMKYIVTKVGTKYETKADTAKDTLIFEAQRYFNSQPQVDYTPLANYYAAQMYDIAGDFPKAMENYMLTVETAEKNNNDLIAGNSYNNIGFIYYQQLLLDSAIVCYRKALGKYDKLDNTSSYKLRTLTNIGRAYIPLNKLDSVYLYFDKCLSLAKESNNKAYHFYSLTNLGVVSYKMQEYDKSIDYYKAALAMPLPVEVGSLDVPKAHLYLLKNYNQKQDISLGKEYVVLVLSDLPKVTYKNTVEEMYTALADHYKLLGDYKQALEYTNLAISTHKQIQRDIDAPALLEVDKNYQLSQKDKVIEGHEEKDNIMYVIMLLIVAVAIVTVLLVKNGRRETKVIDREIQKYEDLIAYLRSNRSDYDAIEADIRRVIEAAEAKAQAREEDRAKAHTEAPVAVKEM